MRTNYRIYLNANFVQYRERKRRACTVAWSYHGCQIAVTMCQVGMVGNQQPFGESNYLDFSTMIIFYNVPS